jgi:hypothetical protein
MTLCMAWRSKNGTVHFASDSRYTVASNSYADVAIKVLSLALTILNPAEPSTRAARTVYRTMELGMWFAGSAINSQARGGRIPRRCIRSKLHPVLFEISARIIKRQFVHSNSGCHRVSSDD